MVSSENEGSRKLQEDMYYRVKLHRFDLELAKTEMITMRVTKPMKGSIKPAAHRYGLTVTEYLTQLHRILSLNSLPPSGMQG